MNTARNEVFRNALELEEDDRVELAGLLLRQSSEHAEPGWEQAWQQEIGRRAAELDSGAVAPVSWEDVRERMIQRVDADAPR